jgi:hypothetical protein
VFFVLAAVLAGSGAEAKRCAQFPESSSTAFDSSAGKITLPWRTDYPTSLVARSHAWDSIPLTDWQAYAAAVLGEVEQAGLSIADGKIVLASDAPWWIVEWMDYGSRGREPMLGLTKERGPDPRDLSPTSSGGHQVWAIGWYNEEGAHGLGQFFADPCNPTVPAPAGGGAWTLPEGTVSFKLLFTDAPATEVPYLDGAPTVEASIDPPSGQSGGRAPRELRLLQVDIAVRDSDATGTGWVMGTFVWVGPSQGDGFFDNLELVGLMWGNDPTVHDPAWAKHAPVSESRLNSALAGVVWQATNEWPERPYPGFQGRLNGPADNLRSSCLSCHALAQWPRGPLGLTPIYPLAPPPDAARITSLVAQYFGNTQGGTVADTGTSVPAVPFDYSLQLQAATTGLCNACRDEVLAVPTPTYCQRSNGGPIDRPHCQKTMMQTLQFWRVDPTVEPEAPPRQ